MVIPKGFAKSTETFNGVVPIFKITKNKSCDCPYCGTKNYATVTRRFCKHLITITHYRTGHSHKYEFVSHRNAAIKAK